MQVLTLEGSGNHVVWQREFDGSVAISNPRVRFVTSTIVETTDDFPTRSPENFEKWKRHVRHVPSAFLTGDVSFTLNDSTHRLDPAYRPIHTFFRSSEEPDEHAETKARDWFEAAERDKRVDEPSKVYAYIANEWRLVSIEHLGLAVTIVGDQVQHQTFQIYRGLTLVGEVTTGPTGNFDSITLMEGSQTDPEGLVLVGNGTFRYEFHKAIAVDPTASTLVPATITKWKFEFDWIKPWGHPLGDLYPNVRQWRCEAVWKPHLLVEAVQVTSDKPAYTTTIDRSDLHLTLHPTSTDVVATMPAYDHAYYVKEGPASQVINIPCPTRMFVYVRSSRDSEDRGCDRVNTRLGVITSLRINTPQYNELIDLDQDDLFAMSCSNLSRNAFMCTLGSPVCIDMEAMGYQVGVPMSFQIETTFEKPLQGGKVLGEAVHHALLPFSGGSIQYDSSNETFFIHVVCENDVTFNLVAD